MHAEYLCPRERPSNVVCVSLPPSFAAAASISSWVISCPRIDSAPETMISWLKEMRKAFGNSFLWLISLVYFTQGFRSFVLTAVSYLLKDMLKLSPSSSQLVFSISTFPWSIKPLYGILSDCIPIKGRKRVPYLVIATLLSLSPWLLLGLTASLRSSHIFLTALLTIQNIGSAIADVVVDAMIAEAVRSERESFAGDLQSLSWSAMAVGGIIGSLLGGYALNNLRIETIFLLFSVFPTLQLFSCVFVNEVLLSSKQANWRSSMEIENLVVNGAAKASPINGNADKTNLGTSRRRKKVHKDEKYKETSVQSKIPCQECSLGRMWLQSIKSAFFSLYQAFKQPIILRPMAWFFLAHAIYPNISTVLFYYQTEFLHMEASFLGTSRVVGWIGLMLGTFIYNRFFKHVRLRRILMWVHVGLAILKLSDVILVTRLNVQFDISDKIVVLFGTAFSDVIIQLKLMPFLILSGRLCPPGIEGTLFALFMSINNLGSTLSSFLGAGLASALNISSDSFENLSLAIAVQVICIFIPIGFLFLIPGEASGISS